MVKVLIVDDSPLIRTMLKELLNQHPEIEVVATARDPYEARDKIKIFNPDVLTLDVEMPKMDGLTFLKNLMRLRPMPVVMISTLTKKGADVTFQALEFGAVDFLEKPKQKDRAGFEEYSKIITDKVLSAASANVQALDWEASRIKLKDYRVDPAAKLGMQVELIAIGASTGGTEAIKEVLLSMRSLMPPIVITQHIPPVFSTSYAKRMDSLLEASVMEVTDDKVPLLPSHIYLAPGDKHLLVEKTASGLYARLKGGEPVNRHKPSVEVLFDSVVQAVKNRALAVILTGMGRDGANALLRLKEAGAYTIAQDKSSSVVWGMPGASVEIGAVREVLSLNRIGPRLMDLVGTNKSSQVKEC